MTKQPTAQRDQQQPRPVDPPDLARFLAEGDELLEGERLCTCDHLDGDHQIGGGRCSRCRCREFLAIGDVEDVTAPGPVPTDEELAAGAAVRSRS
jgi:hypothetical protein